MNHLGVFGKYWEPGYVKTRLAADIGPTAAAKLYREFLQQTLQRHGQTGDKRSLFFSPGNRQSEFRQFCLPEWEIQSQSTGSLGDRMRHYFQKTLERQDDHSVLIGSDTPRLSREIIEQAFQGLQSHPVVLGPSQDGGYYLIGMSGSVVDVFEDIAWSSPKVFEQTIEILKTRQVPWLELPAQNDIDEWEDLKQLQATLASLPDRCPLDEKLYNAICKFGNAPHE